MVSNDRTFRKSSRIGDQIRLLLSLEKKYGLKPAVSYCQTHNKQYLGKEKTQIICTTMSPPPTYSEQSYSFSVHGLGNKTCSKSFILLVYIVECFCYGMV